LERCLSAAQRRHLRSTGTGWSYPTEQFGLLGYVSTSFCTQRQLAAQVCFFACHRLAHRRVAALTGNLTKQSGLLRYASATICRLRQLTRLLTALQLIFQLPSGHRRPCCATGVGYFAKQPRFLGDVGTALTAFDRFTLRPVHRPLLSRT